ncbi:MAG: glycine betaine ABC transporter substrate-binding protein [Pseudomonadales bacterium]
MAMSTWKKGSLAAVFAVASTQVLAQCGTLTIAEMDWASAGFAANLDKIILEEGYGCKVELVPGATNTTFASMEAKGQPDVAPEFWSNGVAVRLKEATAKGDLTVAAQLISDASEGWFISGAIADKYPELKTVDDVLARPDLFVNKEEPGKGAFMGCPAGWGCGIAIANLAKPSAYNFEKAGFSIVDPGSSAGLDGAIAKASERGEAWFGYYWQPTLNASKYGLKKLDFAAGFDQAHWDSCTTVVDCESPQRSSWVASQVNTVVASKFAAENPEVMGYFNKRIYSSAQLGDVLIYMDQNQANGEDAAYYFLENQPQIWQQWLPADVAEKVKKAL